MTFLKQIDVSTWHHAYDAQTQSEAIEALENGKILFSLPWLLIY